MNRADQGRTPLAGPSMISGFSCCSAPRLLMTGFTCIIIVLSLPHYPSTTQSSPPNQVPFGLSLFLTLNVMRPVLDSVYRDVICILPNKK